MSRYAPDGIPADDRVELCIRHVRLSRIEHRQRDNDKRFTAKINIIVHYLFSVTGRVALVFYRLSCLSYYWRLYAITLFRN